MQNVRSPIATWLLFMITGGLYIVYWIVKVTSEINKAEEKEIFPRRQWGVIFMVWLLIYSASLSLVFAGEGFSLYLGIVIVFFGFSFHVFTSIGTYVAIKQHYMQSPSPIKPIGAYFLLFAWGIGLLYLQTNLNSVIEYDLNKEIH